MLVNGVWADKWQPVQSKDDHGRFIRQTSSFRNWVTKDGQAGKTGVGGFKAEKDRYHLYVAYICPWASRTLIVRELKKLTDIISVSVVEPFLSDQGWKFGSFPGSDLDNLNGFDYIHQAYTQSDKDYTGRATVPILWDKKLQVIVNNESADIIRMLNSAFDRLTDSDLDLVPRELESEIEQLNEAIYLNLNNGVYQAGFASSQLAYEEAYNKVFKQIDKIEQRLADERPFLFGNRLTESDIRLFVTLVRFDPAYYGLFKCNRNLISNMKYLNMYLNRILQLPGIKNTVNINHIKRGYYSIKSLNPSGIYPLG